MTVAIPEHTVDVWVAILLARTFPTALIWAPTQTSSPDFDLATRTRDGKLFVLENKAPSLSASVGVEFEIRIAQRQLYNYLIHEELRRRTFYVLPCPRIPPADVPAATGTGPPDSRPPVLIPPAARLRATAPRAFRVMRATDLWVSLWPLIPLPSVGDAWWGRAPPPGIPPDAAESRRLDPCTKFALPNPGRSAFGPSLELGAFLRAIKRCDFFDDLYWPASSDAERQSRSQMPEGRRRGGEGPFSGTTLAVLIEQNDAGTVFPNWPLPS